MGKDVDPDQRLVRLVKIFSLRVPELGRLPQRALKLVKVYPQVPEIVAGLVPARAVVLVVHVGAQARVDAGEHGVHVRDRYRVVEELAVADEPLPPERAHLPASVLLGWDRAFLRRLAKRGFVPKDPVLAVVAKHRKELGLDVLRVEVFARDGTHLLDARVALLLLPRDGVLLRLELAVQLAVVAGRFASHELNLGDELRVARPVDVVGVAPRAMQLDVDQGRVVEVEVPDERVERVDGGDGLEHLVHLGELERSPAVHGDGRRRPPAFLRAILNRVPELATLDGSGQAAPLDLGRPRASLAPRSRLSGRTRCARASRDVSTRCRRLRPCLVGLHESCRSSFWQMRSETARILQITNLRRGRGSGTRGRVARRARQPPSVPGPRYG